MKTFPTFALAVILSLACSDSAAQYGKPSVNSPAASAISAKTDAALAIVAGFGPAPSAAWSMRHSWLVESRNRYGNYFGALPSCAAEPPLQSCDGYPENFGYPQPKATLGQGINNYALAPQRRYCPNHGYYPSVSECPQGWLYIAPEPLY